ncbi:MAG: response regulator [Elusimicrobiota bacterium]|nr:MAG: response regulator [Elusimicrobiota bacterium]
MTARPVLLVEDDPSDVLLMTEALKASRGGAELLVAADGAAAMELLRGPGPRPVLVLLDWRLPCLSGEGVLRAIRADADLRLLPVVVLTTSASEADLRLAYSLGANAFVTKPTGLPALRALVASVESFWLEQATLPPGP